MIDPIQEELDAAIHAWQQEPKAYSGADAANAVEPFLDLAEEWVVLCDVPSVEWKPSCVEHIEDELEPKRAAELLAGAELTKEELEIWDNYCQAAMMICDAVNLYKLKSSGDEVVYFHIGETFDFEVEDDEEFVIDGELLDGSGPHFGLDTLTEYLKDRMQTWEGWGIDHYDEEDAKELESKLTELFGEPAELVEEED